MAAAVSAAARCVQSTPSSLTLEQIHSCFATNRCHKVDTVTLVATYIHRKSPLQFMKNELPSNSETSTYTGSHKATTEHRWEITQSYTTPHSFNCSTDFILPRRLRSFLDNSPSLRTPKDSMKITVCGTKGTKVAFKGSFPFYFS